jgi:DNA-binding GntR family transcriptional regulator
MGSEGEIWSKGAHVPAPEAAEPFVPAAIPRLLREHALEMLRDAIVEGRLKPGTRLTERELCQSLRISRTVVREIVRQLEAERLVEVVAHRGLKVASLSPKAVREIYEVRTELEVLVLRAFITAATQDDIARLFEIRQEFVDIAGNGDLPAIVALMSRYMRLMMSVGNHSVAADLLSRLLARINQLRILSMGEPGRIAASVLEFDRIVEEVAARNIEGAEAAVRTYLRAAAAAAVSQAEAAAEPD